MSIADNKQDFLYKKNLGVVASQGPNVSYQSETAGNARSRIISNLQLFSQPIPQNAPTDLGPKKYVKADGSLETDNDLGLGTVQTSNTYPYIQYVDSLKLSTASKYAYYFNNPGVSTNTNLLSNAVPYNYNPSNTSWAYKVTSSGYIGNVDPSLYIVDTDAGYLYFVNTPDWTANGTPSISFYRYNGTMGIPTNLGNFAGAYAQGTGAIAYGNFAGAYGQGTGSIAIGNLAGPTGMSANSIVLNASGTALYGTGPTGGFYVAPVGSYSGSTGPFTILAYGADKQIVGITGDALKALGIVGGGGGSSNFNIIKYEESSSNTFNVLGYGSNDTEVIRLPITLDAKDVLRQTTINNNLQLPNLFPGNLTYINNSGLLASSDVTTTQLINMSGVNPTNSVAIGNGAGANISGLSDGTYTKWLTSSVVANNNIRGMAMSASGQIQLYGLNLTPREWANSTTTYNIGDILYNQTQNNYYYVTQQGTISSAPSGTSSATLYSYIIPYTANLNLKNGDYVSHQNIVYKISVTGVTLDSTLPVEDINAANPTVISKDVTISLLDQTSSQSYPTNLETNGIVNSTTGYITVGLQTGGIFNAIMWSENMYIPSPSDVNYILKYSRTEIVVQIKGTTTKVYNVYTFTINSNTYTLTQPPSSTSWPTGVSFEQMGSLSTTTSPNIYKSIDMGATFLPIPTSVFPSSSEYKFVVSGDGTYIIAFRQGIAGGSTNFYISTNSGATLSNSQTFQQAPLSFAINADGSYIMLVSTGGIYVTNKTNLNFGSSKATITASSASCAMTPDGKHMRAIINGTAMYTSSDYGVTTFTQVFPSGLPMSNLSLIAISGTGLYQLVSTTNILYVSTNTGTTFASKLSNTNPSITIISSIAVSRKGQYMIACCSSSSVKGYVYYSTNFGENWQIMTALGFDFFNNCAISADGTFFTVSTPSNIYTLNNNLIGNTVAIGKGAGQTNQPANTIAINASGTALNPSTSNGCYIAPIADVSNSASTVFNLLGYGSDNQVVKSNVFINSTGNSIINNYSPTKEDIGYFLKAGNASFYIGDDYSSLPTGSGITYGRYFGAGGSIYQDFSGSFIWRRVTNASNALTTSFTCMTLNNSGDLSTTGNISASGNITASGNISASGNITASGITASGNSNFGNLYALGRLGVNTNVPGYSLDVNGDARTGSLRTNDITANGNITAKNVFSRSSFIEKIPIHSRTHQDVGIRVPSEGVYLVTARGLTYGWHNFAIIGVNSSGNRFADNTLAPVNNIYLGISNYEVTMLIPGGDDWLGQTYEISATKI